MTAAAILALAAGFLLIYVGLRGVSFTSELRRVFGGTEPESK